MLQKPELNKILAKRKETQKRKEWDEMQANKRTSLELKLEERANKIKEKVSRKGNSEGERGTGRVGGRGERRWERSFMFCLWSISVVHH